MALNDREKKQIDVYCAEYQACHRNRNHYDSVRWTIGSIFIATSLALFGISFMQEVRESFLEVNLIAIFSFLLLLVWYAYNQHVNPYVMESILRFHKIEQELRDMDFDISLHESIFEATPTQWRGIQITFCLFVVTFTAWVGRIILSWLARFILLGIVGLVPVIAYLALMIMVLIAHTRIFNVPDYRSKIEATLRKVVYCPGCGTKNQAEAVYCKECGEKLEKPTSNDI